MNKAAELWPGGPIMQQEPGAPLGTDTVLLGAFARPAGAARCIDLGCGAGALTLLLLTRSEKLRVTGLELRPEAAQRARENLAANGWEARAEIVTGDLRESRTLFRSGSFELAVSNPPYFPAGSGAASPDPARRAAREESFTLPELVGAAAYLLRTGGRFFVVHRAERLAELFAAMSAAGLEPKRMRLVAARQGAAPSLVLAEGRRGGKPGLTVEPTLLLREPDGSPTAEYRRIYHLE